MIFLGDDSSPSRAPFGLDVSGQSWSCRHFPEILDRRAPAVRRFRRFQDFRQALPHWLSVDASTASLTLPLAAWLSLTHSTTLGLLHSPLFAGFLVLLTLSSSCGDCVLGVGNAGPSIFPWQVGGTSRAIIGGRSAEGGVCEEFSWAATAGPITADGLPTLHPTAMAGFVQHTGPTLYPSSFLAEQECALVVDMDSWLPGVCRRGLKDYALPQTQPPDSTLASPVVCRHCRPLAIPAQSPSPTFPTAARHRSRKAPHHCQQRGCAAGIVLPDYPQLVEFCSHSTLRRRLF